MKADAPTAAVGGSSDWITGGGPIVKLEPAVVRIPTATVIVTDPAFAIRPPGTAAVNWLALT
jgi:hypothetical protein